VNNFIWLKDIFPVYFICRYDEYMHWFFTNGMTSVFPNQNSATILSQAVPEPQGDVGNLGYVSDAISQARIVSISSL
jgi:hypothetical protein